MKRLAVVGAGLSGNAAVRLARILGNLEVTLYDDNREKSAFQTPEEMLRKFKPDTLLVSPGVPLSTPWIREALKNGIALTSELDFALGQTQDERYIAVTGSVGKSTTVALLGAGLQSLGPQEGFVGGNFGHPLADYMADVLEGKRRRARWVVLELSSYQLENLKRLKPEVAVITSLHPNHLERYESLEHYYATKWTLAGKAQGFVVLNENGGDLKAYAARQPPPPVPVVTVSRSRTFLEAEDFRNANLLGTHNWDNLAVAAQVGRSCGWEGKFLRGMLDFDGLPHRLQRVAEISGITFVNDSKATTMESVLVAATSLAASWKCGRIMLLLGGRDKKLPWAQLSALSQFENLRPVFFGECGARAAASSGLPGPIHATLREAVQAARGELKSGDLLLLSPGGTSLDEFKNFEDRGNQFKQWVYEGWLRR